MIHHLAIFNNWSMRWSPFKQIKLTKSLGNTKLHIRVCFARLGQIQLQQLFTGKETTVLKSLPAVVVLYFTASEKENLRTERKKTINRKRIELLFSSRVSLLAFYFRDSFKRTSFSSPACVCNMVLSLKTGIKLVLQREGKLKNLGT